MHLFTEF
ncbi:hypothetical protein V1477_020229 [Vespula maculifrons]